MFSANLGVALSQLGKTVVLVDLDLGGANLHTCLGIRNSHAGIGNFIHKQAESLESLIVETHDPRLYFIPGDSLIPGTANLPYFRKVRILKDLEKLVADYVILDLGSGSAYNTVDFFLGSAAGIVVTTPETTAVLNAYSFLKTALYRLILRSYPPRSPERALIEEFVVGKIEGTEHSFSLLVENILRHASMDADIARQHIATFRPRVVLNMGRSAVDIRLGSKLREIVRRNLSIDVDYIGLLPYEPLIPGSIVERRVTSSAHPESAYAVAVSSIARKIASAPVHSPLELHEADDDLESLEKYLPK